MLYFNHLKGQSGTDEDALFVFATRSLFEACSALQIKGFTVKVSLSIIEIYNERIQDRLGKEAGHQAIITHPRNDTEKVFEVKFSFK